MMIRQGFVSNSSTSSFVVLYKHQRMPLAALSPGQQDKLIELGFKYTPFSDLTGAASHKELAEFKPHENIFMRCDIVCNQDDVILELLENSIPFIAATHYDEEIVAWDGQAEYFIERPNEIALMPQALQHSGKISMNETIKIKKHNVQHFIARELKYKNQ